MSLALVLALGHLAASDDASSRLLEGQGLGHVEQRLRAEGLRGVCDFELLSDDDLRAVGVTQLLPRRRLQRAASELCDQQRGRHPEPPPPPPATGIEGVKTFSCIENGPTGMPFAVGTNVTETTICEHNTSTPGAITHMQFTYTDLATAYIGARFRAYVDGETSPSIDVQMEPGMFGIAGPDLDRPSKGTTYLPPLWGNARFGHGGETGAASKTGGGGRYFNFRIPFTAHIRLAVYRSVSAPLGMFSIVHGAEGVAATAGGLTLPPSARLRVAEVSNKRVAQYEQVTALNSSSPGVMAMWIFSVGQSTMGIGFIEGCQRAWLDAELVQLGDGEDYFDSSFGYQSGVYAFPYAGLVAASAAPGYDFMSYRIADPNPVVWQSTVKVTWRAGEDYYDRSRKRVGKCNDAGEWPPVNPKLGVVVSSYFWYYQV